MPPSVVLVIDPLPGIENVDRNGGPSHCPFISSVLYLYRYWVQLGTVYECYACVCVVCVYLYTYVFGCVVTSLFRLKLISNSFYCTFQTRDRIAPIP